MQVVVQLPDEIAKEIGTDAEIQRRVLEAVALEGYRGGRLTSGQVAELLGLSRWQAEEFLDAHGVKQAYTLEMLEEDRRTLAQLSDR